jgi:3-oxoacyl-[acyl-carrier protein] reductase
VERLAGRAALVTGVSRRAGIGFAITRRLVAEGGCVFATGWRPHDATQPWGADPEAEDELRALGDRVRYSEADLADPDAPRAIVAAAGSAYGHVDVLIVNHARSGHGRLADVTASELDAFLHENVRAAILLVKEFAAQHDGRLGGRVVLLTSGQHLAPMTREVAYAVSKGALHQATKTLADELIDQGNNRQRRQSRSHRYRLGDLGPRPASVDAARPMGRARRRRTSHRLALQRRSRLDHWASDRLRGRLPPLNPMARVATPVRAPRNTRCGRAFLVEQEGSSVNRHRRLGRFARQACPSERTLAHTRF